MSRPLRSTLITRASSLLRAGPPACRHRYSTPHSFCCSTRSLSPPAAFSGHRQQYQHTPSHVPCSSCRSGSRRLHTGHRLASRRVSARLIPRISTDLSFDVVSCISMLHQRFALTRLPDPCLTAFTPPFPSSLTTPVFSLCSMRWLDISPRRATPKGHKTFIYSRALLPRDRPTLRPPIRIRGARGCTARCRPPAGTSRPSSGPAWVSCRRPAAGSHHRTCLLYTSPSPRDGLLSR